MESIDREINNSSNEELDFNEFFKLFIRFKKLIFAFSFLGLIIGSFLGLNAKKVWQGEFQIVVETLPDSLSSLSSQLPLNLSLIHI